MSQGPGYLQARSQGKVVPNPTLSNAQIYQSRHPPLARPLGPPTPSQKRQSHNAAPDVCQSNSRLLLLPPELRLNIYSHVADFLAGRKHGRSRFRVDWTAKALPESPEIRDLANLVAVCHTIRSEILPLFLKSYIVKFPSWDPGFKLQCLYWVQAVSEEFVNNIDFFWMEGVYWRVSIRLGKSEVHEEEDARATREDCHRYHKIRTMACEEVGCKFVVKVEFARQEQTQMAAEAACRKTHDVVKDLLMDRGDNRLGKEEMADLIREMPLCGFEQLRILQ